MSDLIVGDQVKVTELGGDFQATAQVCGSWTGTDHIPRLNLRFVDGEAPRRLVGVAGDADEVPSPRARMTPQPAPHPEPPPVPAQPAATPPPPSPPSPPPAAEPPPTAEPPATAEPPPAAEPAPAAQAEAPAAAAADEDALRAEVVALFSSLKSRSCYELLDVKRDADVGGITKGYARQVRRFHPDMARGSLTDLKDMFAAIFLRIGEARELLSDPDRRKSYDRMLGPIGSPTPQPTAPTVPATPAGAATGSEPLNAEQDALLAEKRLAYARKLYQDEKFYDAILTLEASIPDTKSTTLRNTMRVLLARANAKNPKWVRRAEEMLLDVIKDDPRNVFAHLALGQMYKDSGLATRAARMFRKVLEIDPSNKEGAAELNALMATRRI